MSKINEEMDFEQAFGALQQAVEALENPSMKLEEHIELYEKACELALLRRKKLDSAKLRITDINERLAQAENEKTEED